MKIKNTRLMQQLMKNGGFTYNTKKDKLVNAKKGYVVALAENEKIINSSDILVIDKALTKYLKDYQNEFKKGKLFQGAWKFESKVYLDTVIIFKNEKKAIKFAKENNQIAYYDLKNNKEKKVK